MDALTPVPPLRVIDLGRIDYASAYRLQREAREALAAGPGAGTLFVLEHDPPVVTVSRRPGARSHLLASAERFASLGIEVVETDRGGDVTYHGPGQIVGYLITDLRLLGLGVHEYLRFLEEAIIATLGRFGIAGRRDECATGVWVEVGEGGGSGCGDGTAKIAALGVRVARGITMHGLALNVDPDLSHFETIVPCGLAGRAVTSMAAVAAASGGVPPGIAEVKAALAEEIERGVAERLAQRGASGVSVAR